MESRVRYESFGGIIGLTEPPALVFVDQQYMRELGHDESPLWQRPRSHLTAPTEVHFNLTRRCMLSCRHCTSSATSHEAAEMTGAQAREGIDALAAMGVFHIAFGGGELFLRDDAIELARHARQRGLVPNATTNGHRMSEALARQCRVFGQVNVSVDGVGDSYGLVRGSGDFAHADQALRWLTGAGVCTGINCVVSRLNFDRIEEVVAYADRLGLKEVLLLRIKPSGRATRAYPSLALTAEQGRAFYPMLKKLAKRYRPTLQIDCSLVPHICAHRPSKKAMQALGVEGCGGGDMLLGVNADGAMNACSHYPQWFGQVSALAEVWDDHAHFRQFRERKVTDPRCQACGYFSLCRGGCPLFSEFLAGDFHAPDPECPVLLAG
ncbi:MAG: radical SAM protein [Deltaproteobacteria bacterium]|nr:radical SAM protein [Deltaproteobacteria bacterium]